MNPDNKEYKLYWCTTDDHQEDWFFIAKTKAGAAAIFALETGYKKEGVQVELVVRPIKENLKYYEYSEGRADWKDLEAYGGKIVLSRVVMINGRLFREGCPIPIWEEGSTH